MKTAYYAHPIALYGSAIETQDIATLRALGFEVVNPASKQYAVLDMNDFVALARTCDLVAFRAFEDGQIGSGMAKEIDGAMAACIPVIELPSQMRGRYLTRNQTRQRMCLPPLRHPKTAPLRTVSDDPIRSHLGWDDDGLEMGDT